MAANGSVLKIDHALRSIQDRVHDRRSAWTQVQQTFSRVEHIIRSFDENARAQQGHADTRKVIFEERTKFIDVLNICMNLRQNRRKFQDVFKSLKTLVEFEEQTIDELVQELKLSDYGHLFTDKGIEHARELLDIDQKAIFEAHMKTAPFKRLQKKTEHVNVTKEYVEYRLDGDISTAAKETQRDLEQIERGLVASFTTIDGLQRQAGGNNKNIFPLSDVLGLTVIGCSALLAYFIYEPIISPLIVILTSYIFRSSVRNALRWYRYGDADSQNTYNPASVQTEPTDQWAACMRRWVDVMIAELNEWVQLMKSFKGHLSTGDRKTSDASSQMIRRTHSQLEHFLEDVDALEAELKRISSRTVHT